MRAKRQTGAELLEFALVLPILLAIIFTVLQFGWLFFNQVVLTAAASNGARVLATERDYAAPYTDTMNAVLSAAGILPNSRKSLLVNVAVSGAPCTSDASCSTALDATVTAPSAGPQASVSLSYPFVPIFGRWFRSSPVTLKASTSEFVQ